MDSLGITAVIATILSMIFAAAALWNSIARRRHEAQMARRDAEETEKFSFKPMPSGPAISSQPIPSRSTHPSAHPGRKAAPAAGTPPVPLFRQIRPTGEVEAEKHPEDEDMYVWE